MEQMTVKELCGWLFKLVKEGHGDKVIVVADDTEGNGYHGMFYTPTYFPDKVKENIECSNGIYDSVTEDPNKIVILG